MKLRTLSLILLSALTSPAFANGLHVEPASAKAPVTDPGKFYAGVFGGYGSSNDFNASQLGTIFFIEADGGPLAVDAFGQLDGESVAFFGAQFGYQAQGILFNPSSRWTLQPAAELEGYHTNDRTFDGTLVNNTDRLDVHHFAVSYPTSRTIFLANAVLNFNNPSLVVRPYVGFGIGNAVVRISDATSLQSNPSEPGINHYTTDDSDTDMTFAGQIKLGLSYDISKCVSLFAEYRWLYLGNTDFVFGSTIAPAHAPTSPWQVELDDQRYHSGSVGIRFSL